MVVFCTSTAGLCFTLPLKRLCADKISYQEEIIKLQRDLVRNKNEETVGTELKT